MLSLGFIAILAISAVASGTTDPVDCTVTTDFQGSTLKAAVLTGSLPADNKFPVPYRGLVWGSSFGVAEGTAMEHSGTDLNVSPYIAVDTANNFTKLMMEQYAEACLARTDSTLISYLINCTVEILDGADLSKAPIDTFRYQRTQKIDLSALKDDRFDSHKVENPQQLPVIVLRAIFHLDSTAQLIGGTSSLTSLAVLFDNFVYGLEKAPGKTAQCPGSLNA
ncbi:hypothetical protein PG994_006127 [Apiospora phragmitis]|uniref:Secreted protein n=1 Tax=Apiospora phragmitis TaxID=2905665 RepID=A0ABR1VE60_9PEZI